MGEAMTKNEAQRTFERDIRPYLQHQDRVAVRTAWNDFTDALCKAGQISQRQYETWGNPYL